VSSVWEKTTGSNSQGEPVVIALIGSGIDYTNADLRDSLWVNPGEISEKAWANDLDNDLNGYQDDSIGYDFYDGDALPYDWHGHDTYLASLIASSGRSGSGVIGVAPNAKLMVLRTIGADGRGSVFETLWAIDYAIDNGARIIHLNLPKGAFGSMGRILSSWMERAAAKNVLVVIPAGNDSNFEVGDLIGESRLLDMENVLVVSGVDESGKLTSTTNYGKNLSSLGAPARQSFGYFPGGETQRNGLTTSSVASAYVAGAAALVASLPGYGRVKDIRQALLNEAKVSEAGLAVLSQGTLDLHFLSDEAQ
jgi:subtilisin family serine protease